MKFELNWWTLRKSSVADSYTDGIGSAVEWVVMPRLPVGQSHIADKRADCGQCSSQLWGAILRAGRIFKFESNKSHTTQTIGYLNLRQPYTHKVTSIEAKWKNISTVIERKLLFSTVYLTYVLQGTVIMGRLIYLVILKFQRVVIRNEWQFCWATSSEYHVVWPTCQSQLI